MFLEKWARRPLFALSLLLLVFPASGSAAEKFQSTPRALLPEGVASFGAAVDGDWLYVLGGHRGRAHRHSIENLSPSFRRLNLVDGTTWEELPAGTPSQSTSLVANAGKLYRVGGLTARNATAREDERLHSLDEFQEFDPLTRTWTSLTPLPERRSSHDAVVLGQHIYVIGGWTLTEGEKGQWVSTAWKADLSRRPIEWESVPSPEFQRRALAVSAHGDRLVAVGGLTDEGDMTSRVQIFDTGTGAWSEGPEFPGKGFGVSGFVLGGRAHFSGMDGELRRLDASGKSWEIVGELLFPRFFHRLVAQEDGNLIVVGGAAASGHVRQIEVLRSRPVTPAGIVAHFRLPWQGEARQRQALAVRGDRLFLAGGNRHVDEHRFEPGDISDEVLAISLSTLKTSVQPDLPAARQSAAFISTGPGAAGNPLRRPGRLDALTLVGGFGHDGEVARSHAEVQQLKLRRGEWRVPEWKLPAPWTQGGVAVHEGSVWLLGGLDYAPREDRKTSFRHLRSVVQLKLAGESAGAEVTELELPRARRAFANATLDGAHYLVGGMRDGFELVEPCDVLDLEKGTWSTIPSPARPRLSASLVPIRGKLYLVGGTSRGVSGELEPDLTIEAFDPRTRTWERVADRLPLEAGHFQALAYRDHVLLVSTARGRRPVLELILWSPGDSLNPSSTF